MLSFKNVSKRFGEVVACEGVSFDVGRGEFVFITGPSGAGKTTLIRLILAELKPDEGRIELDKVRIDDLRKGEVPTLRRRIGVVFQDFKLLSDRTVAENVAVGLQIRGEVGEDIERKVRAVLKLVGLSERADFFPAQLAGGELQRTVLARAVVVDPDLLLADEPTGNLDKKTAWQIMELLAKINQSGTTVLMATHNEEVVKKMGKRVISMERGRIVGGEEKVKVSRRVEEKTEQKDETVREGRMEEKE